MSAYTPGPWDIDNRWIGSGDKLIAELPQRSEARIGKNNIAAVLAEDAANGRLLAAAPELGEMLLKIVRAFDRSESGNSPLAGLISDDARAVLAKAGLA